ncbi:hypothetical protein NDU88_003726 [Pleurodeles waltl]|uniref:Uncharacterized protein n=1 Tax=Pleurodeles waltl TaxID=8319 RepID=A0AAV7VE41_PLEWA|nr:hypothetical protein NDU88_003726 [Pleurodeles waltl]
MTSCSASGHEQAPDLVHSLPRYWADRAESGKLGPRHQCGRPSKEKQSSCPTDPGNGDSPSGQSQLLPRLGLRCQCGQPSEGKQSSGKQLPRRRPEEIQPLHTAVQEGTKMCCNVTGSLGQYPLPASHPCNSGPLLFLQ